MTVMRVILLLLFLFTGQASRFITEYCVNSSTVVYNYEGNPSIIGTLINCLKAVKDGLIAPYYDTHVRINVSTEVFLNNLISVNELSSTVSLDLFFQTRWVDHRLSMPALWEALNSSSLNSTGVDISEAVEVDNIQGVQPAIWLPDIVFPDAISITQSEQYLKLFPGGELWQMQHLIMTFSQSTMYYADYPCDTQNITIRFFSFTLTDAQLVFQPISSYDGLTTPPVDFIYPEGSSAAAFSENPIWTLVSTAFAYVDFKISPGFYTRPFGIVSFTIARKSTGILKRLCVPVLLIMLLCALSYWGTVNDRIATTVTALLAIAALYIGIVNSIPLVGYMTRLDSYMLLMFVIVFTNTILHMTCVRMNVQEKGTNWPLRKLTVRLIEFLGRLTMIPWIISTYIACFYPAVSLPGVVIVTVLLAAFEYVLLRRYLPEMHDTVLRTIEHIELKQKLVARTNKVTISSLELRFLKYVKPFFPASNAAGRMSSAAMEAGKMGARGGDFSGPEIEMQDTQRRIADAPMVAGAREGEGTLNPLSE